MKLTSSSAQVSKFKQFSIKHQFSLLTYSWLTPLLKKLQKNPNYVMQVIDVPQIPANLHPRTSSQVIAKFFNTAKQSQRSLFKILFKSNQMNFVFMTGYAIILALCGIMLPLALSYFTDYYTPGVFYNCDIMFSDNPSFETFSYQTSLLMLLKNLIGWVFCFLIAEFLYVYLEQACISKSIEIGVSSSSGLMDLVYNKIIKLNECSRQKASNGNVVNLLFSDTQIIIMFFSMFYWIILLPLNMIACAFFIIFQIDAAGLSGYIGMFITFSASTFFLTQYFKASDKAFAVRDQRISRTQEIVNGIKVVKFFVLENIQEKRVENVRTKELRLYKIQNILYSLLYADSIITLPMMTLIPFIILFFTNKFTYSSAVTISFSFQLVSNSVTSLPLLFALWSQAMVSSNRIQAFFNLNEQEDGVVVQKQMENIAICTEQPISFTWGLKQDQITPVILDPLYEQKQVIIKQLQRILPKLSKQYNLARAQYLLKETEQYYDIILSETYSKQFVDLLCVTINIIPISQVGSVEQYDNSIFQNSNKFTKQHQLFLLIIQIQLINKLLAQDLVVVDNMPDTLTDVDFKVKKGELVGLCGKVACGKTSIFQAILGEMRLSPTCRDQMDAIINQFSDQFILENEYRQRDNRVVKLIEQHENIPHLYIDGIIAYCPQQPTILSMTIRDNIIFGHQFNQQKYNEIIELCCLLPDIKSLEDGDQTYIGSRGINLSGGQKARVCLARAVYADADIYLFDDPLSAVDANVGSKIWQGVIMKYLKQKTVLIASHQTHFFTDCDRIMMIEDGQIAAFDTLQNIRKMGGTSINSLIEETSSFSESQKLYENSLLSNEQSQILGAKPVIFDNKKIENDIIELPEHAEIFAEETFRNGPIPGIVYKSWFKAGNKLLIFVFLIFLACAQAVLQYQQIVVSDWTSDTYGWNRAYAETVDPIVQCQNDDCKKYVKQAFDLLNTKYINSTDYSYMNDGLYVCAANVYNVNTNPDQKTSIYYLFLYIGLTVILMILGFIGYTAQAQFSLSASKELHEKMIYSLIRQPAKFFDQNSQGKIMNRVSKDIDSLDNVLLKYFFDIIYDIMGISGVIIQIIILNYISLVVIIPFIAACIWLFFKLRKSVPQIKRFETICRTPVFNTCVETLNNLITIRSFGKANYFQQQFREQVLQSTAMTFTQRCTNRWYSIRFGMFATIFATVVPFLALFYGPLSSASVLYSGQIVSMSHGICFLLTYYVNALMQLEGEMPSVERILEFANMEIESQKGDIIENVNWPSKNSIIELQDIKFQYTKDHNYILKGLNIKLNPGEHVGIVGRTGAGKSTVTLAMFRFCEPEGRIMVDGENILTLKLQQARKCFSIIPQEPFLFSGTLRQNLCQISQAQSEGITTDSTKRITDEQLWMALDKVQMREYFEGQDDGLDFKILPNGANFSSGQRQLICVARAILQNACCIILDEATAYIDREKDKIIQETIKQALQGVTVLSIAHRLNTIIDFDRVIVLDAGKIAEFDTPAQLLRNNGQFASMVARTGADMAQNLRNTAFDAERKRMGTL